MKYFLYLYVYTCLISPFLLNQIFKLESTSLGFIVGQLFLCILSAMYMRVVLYKKYVIILFVALYILVFVTFSSTLISEGQSSFLNPLGLIFALLLTVINSISFYQCYTNNYQLFKGFIKFSLISSIILTFSPGYIGKGVLLFGEPSFFALFFGPMVCIWAAISNRLYIPCIILLFYAIWFPNLTMLLFVIMITLSHLKLKNLFYITFIFLIAFALAFPFLQEYLSGRLTFDPSEANASNLLYFVNLLDLQSRILEFNFFGDGVGAEARTITNSNPYASELLNRYQSMNSMSAGVFLTARLVQTIGYIGLIPLIYIFFQLVKLKIYSANSSSKTFLLQMLLFSLLPCFIFRSSGILSFSTFLFVFSFTMITLTNSSKKEGNINVYK